MGSKIEISRNSSKLSKSKSKLLWRLFATKGISKVKIKALSNSLYLLAVATLEILHKYIQMVSRYKLFCRGMISYQVTLGSPWRRWKPTTMRATRGRRCQKCPAPTAPVPASSLRNGFTSSEGYHPAGPRATWRPYHSNKPLMLKHGAHTIPPSHFNFH